MNTTSTSSDQLAATSCERATCQRTRGASPTSAAHRARQHAAGGPLGGTPPARQRVRVATEGVDQMQFRVRAEHVAQRDRRGALVHADLDHPARARHRVQEHPGILGGMHRARRDQAKPDRQRPQAHVVAQAGGREAAHGRGRIDTAPDYAHPAAGEGGGCPAADRREKASHRW